MFNQSNPNGVCKYYLMAMRWHESPNHLARCSAQDLGFKNCIADVSLAGATDKVISAVYQFVKFRYKRPYILEHNI